MYKVTVDLQSLCGIHVHSCTNWQRPRKCVHHSAYRLSLHWHTGATSHVIIYFFILYIFGGANLCWPLHCHVAKFVFLRDVWIRTQRATIARRRATDLATHLPG